MYKILLESHSGLRYIVFLLLVIAVGIAISGFAGKKGYSDGNRKLNLFTMIAVHIQFMLGILLYFSSPFVQYGNMGAAMKDDSLRYWTVEHAFMMLIAIALITIGHSKSKKLVESGAKHRTIALFYGLGLVVIIVAIVLSGRGLFGMTH